MKKSCLDVDPYFIFLIWTKTRKNVNMYIVTSIFMSCAVLLKNCRQCTFVVLLFVGWRTGTGVNFLVGLSKMTAIEKVVNASYVRELVEGQGKTHKERSEILKQAFPGENGLSERSIRRYCTANGIQRHDSNLACLEVDNVVSKAISEVCIFHLDFSNTY